MPWAASQTHPWNLARWEHLASYGAAELTIYLASDLTNCALGGSPSNTPSLLSWEVKRWSTTDSFSSYFSIGLSRKINKIVLPQFSFAPKTGTAFPNE